ncbi:MAG: FAD-dependent oxidoreductase, partial [Burkholderiaceae bacterium]
MLRLSEIKISLSALEKEQAALMDAVAEILGLASADMTRVTVFKRSFDARQAQVMAVYIVDVEVAPA